MALAPYSKNVLAKKNPYGSLGPAPTTVKKVNALQGLGGAAPASNVVPPHLTTTTPGKAAVAGSWFKPNYDELLQGDWEPMAAEKAGTEASDSAEAAFQKALRTAFIDYGGDSSKLGNYSKYIDAPTIEAAQQNKFSQTAQNLAAMTKSLAQARANAAARGMTFSGQSTENSRLALEAKELSDVNAERGFLSGAGEEELRLAGVKRDIADKIAEARSRAAARITEQNPWTWQEGTEAVAPTTTVESDYERALRLRGEGMNAAYGLGGYATPRPAAPPPRVIPPQSKPGTAAWYRSRATPIPRR